jgi:NADPH:quinone reductase-like Zn-dependent oxidoreductase
MHAAGIDGFGHEVRMLEFPGPPTPTTDEVVIAVRAAGVGNWDEFVRLGTWDVGRRPPLALGVEAAGIVEAAGEDVTTLAPGDDVLTHPCRSETGVAGRSGSSHLLHSSCGSRLLCRGRQPGLPRACAHRRPSAHRGCARPGW